MMVMLHSSGLRRQEFRCPGATLGRRLAGLFEFFDAALKVENQFVALVYLAYPGLGIETMKSQGS
jgi:hypothetical protein